ncbi:DNA mismatch repair protein MutS [Alkalicella caledoniensis]|uniref:DNA mismatch repair protein MutS n=1 Tax=Alkalicella caledoniensis TaxID=2731377 RepID=A0A7G9W5T0_ALKCA|nr:DNA mismatch repair protein MutS [Alkalicella caledoniensis]QNO14042.1 DNA mismatch repair protein MutS [Alkalicella caledoniensis]
MPDSRIFILVSIVVGVFIVNIWNHRKKLRKLREEITRGWGKQKKVKYSEDELESISSYFRNTKESKGFYIDDITWNDLNMNEVFSRINNTQSSVGEEFLYNKLREPLFEEDQLRNMDGIIKYFEEKAKEREDVAFNLAKLGKDRGACASDFFNQKWTHANKSIYYRVLGLIPLISIGLSFVNPLAILVFFASIAANTLIHVLRFKETEFQMRRLNYIVSMIQCANGILKLDLGLKNYFNPAREALSNLKSIKKSGFSFPQGMIEMDIFMEYTKMFFLTDVIKLEKINNTIGKNQQSLKILYEFLGYIDSLISVASYRKSLNCYTKPVLNHKQSKQLAFKEIYHPLITNPVSNSCDIHKSILVTGSNASGKSTFLKTIAINSILAQTIYTCLAREYESSYFKTYTSMALKDDLMGNESYYIVEIKSLKRIIESIDNSISSLCFIDEILRGTNTVERISASSEVLDSIAKSNCLCVSATHDVELTRILRNVFENYHFQEEIIEDEIIFDYKLYPGRAETRNAIKLLSIMGYSSEIVSKAENRAKSFLDRGVWNEIS